MTPIFNEEDVLHKLKHFLPAQAPLKDFVHHNTLHSFQEKEFFKGLRSASTLFGYRTIWSFYEYREFYRDGKISDEIINKVILTQKGSETKKWFALMMSMPEEDNLQQRIGLLRNLWSKKLKIDLPTMVNLNLFKITNAYLDQGISIQKFPNHEKGLLKAVQMIERNTLFELFHSKRVKELLFKENKSLKELLEIIVGDETLFQQYLFDQQFSHPGWSGMVAVIEHKPETLLDKKEIQLFDFIYLELLFEIDALDKVFNSSWLPIEKLVETPPSPLFAEVELNEYWAVKELWQESLEWMYFDNVLAGITLQDKRREKSSPNFQAFFCIDDREESLRRHIEGLEPNCATYGTPAHFSLEIMYQPHESKFHTQICPGGSQPKHLIKGFDPSAKKMNSEIHFNKNSQNLFSGWMIAQTVGFWSAIKLFLNVFRPSANQMHSSSFEHMSHTVDLKYSNAHGESENGLQIGLTVPEMANVLKKELLSTGLKTGFAPLVYFFGHGGSSTNNPYYAGYNCGACSGRPSSVNARIIARIANRSDVREILENEGISIPISTQFIGGLHDTTRDEFVFYDEQKLNETRRGLHETNKKLFTKALINNAHERSRQFVSINKNETITKIHKEVKLRSVALFEPRPELNHSNNCLCIVGNRSLTRNVFLDQRAFLNSYDYKLDPNGEILKGVLNAATPVCGGINLEYYFSRVDPERLGAGSKLPHNVVGLYGVVNGIEGDLRTGLPIQMTEVHDPLRLMMIVEHLPEIVLKAIESNPATYEWYKNGWMKLAVIDPTDKQIYIFRDGDLHPYLPINRKIEKVDDLSPIFNSETYNLPVFQINS
ncbi:MAG: hypothetical protein ACJA1C_002502 [Crocinitomicaceae bacterium]|jgi:uncharacterized protein YbcC (UPF0753/DUF2309 family)